MSERCKHIEKSGFNCGSYAFNLYKDGIDQGNLCDVHYWQAKATQQEQDHIPDARKMVTEQEPCDMGEMCLGCSPRRADGSCPDAKLKEKNT